jgi:hypothetical protein
MAEVNKGYSLTHCWEFYREKTKDKISRILYRKICCDFNKLITEAALNSKAVKLPHFAGRLWIKKCRTNWEHPKVDFYETKKRGKTIYHDNEHSSGWWARWNWNKYTRVVHNTVFYKFVATRKMCRTLAVVMKQPDGYKKFFSQIV